MRLFIGIKLNDEVKDFLDAAMQELRKNASKGNFTHRENLHLTLVFLGEHNPDRLGAMKEAIDKVNGEPFSLSVSGFGRFRRNGGDIHWAGVEKNVELVSLHKQLAEELTKEGFSIEDRAYSPHLTLGREVRLTKPSEEIYGQLSHAKRNMAVSRISLMLSERVNGKLTYTEIYGRDL